MDDLHNLRSGKLKQPERGRRDYTDYKGTQRRGGNERRKPDCYAKVTSEKLAWSKQPGSSSDHQGRMANTMAARKKNRHPHRRRAGNDRRHDGAALGI